ncbi:hypothetical protein Tco_0608541, partial [Tanacetum coccineum]
MLLDRKEPKILSSSSPAPVKAVELCCVTCVCPFSSELSPLWHRFIGTTFMSMLSQAAAANYNQ